MEFGQLMTDILGNVSCKFEMYIFKIAQVINENVRIAFLYVLSICICYKKICKQMLWRFNIYNLCSFTHNNRFSCVKGGWGNSRADNSISTKNQNWHHCFL